MTKAIEKLRRLAVLGALIALAATAAPVEAQQPPPGPHRMERGGPGPGPGYGPPPGHRGEGQRGDGQRGMGPGHGQRMSPEEREQLRRDISNHGRDVYRERDRDERRERRP